MKSDIKRYTFLKLTLEPLDIIDIAALIIFTVSIVINFYSIEKDPKLHFSNELFFGIISWAFITTGTFGIRFKKAYFSVAWLICSILILYCNHSISYLPLICFLQYHFFRVMFWNKQGRELIPFDRAKDHYYRFYSKSEGRAGVMADKSTMKWIFRIGFIVLMICMFGMVGTKV